MYGSFFFFQAEDGIRDLVRSRGLGDVYKRQKLSCSEKISFYSSLLTKACISLFLIRFLARFCIISIETVLTPLTTEYYGYCQNNFYYYSCLLYTSDAADERSSVDLGGRRIIKKKTNITTGRLADTQR